MAINSHTPSAIGKLTLITASVPKWLGKRLRMTSVGLQKEVAGALVAGTYEVREFNCAADLAELLVATGVDQALTASLPFDESQGGSIVTKSDLPRSPHSLTRTKEHFVHPVGQAGVLVLDHDPKPGAPYSIDDLWSMLKEACPAVCDAGVLHWSSSSSWIYSGDQLIRGASGLRMYVLVSDLSDVPRAGRTLGKRLWLAGHGYINVSESGALLVRCPFDEAVFRPAHLEFAGGAICEPPLEQRRPAPVVASDGAWLDTRRGLPELSVDEELRYEALVADAKAKAEPDAETKKAAWVTSRIDSGMVRLLAKGVPAEQAKDRLDRTFRSALSRILMGDFTITLEDGRAVTVAEVLDNRERYHGERCLDPLNPGHRGGAPDGRLFLFGARPCIFSFDDGGVTYTLRQR